MKRLIQLSLFLFTAISFGQNTGLIVGNVLDSELNNVPLMMANVSVKGTSINLNTDLTGSFVIENLEAGDYTLVCSFAGYETKEIKVHVDAFKPAEVKLALSASTVSLSELVFLSTTSKKEDLTVIASK